MTPTEDLHNKPGACPICYAEGIFDTKTPTGFLLEEGTNWIWWNKYSKSWECGECWLK